jgi:hypothetical protein
MGSSLNGQAQARSPETSVVAMMMFKSHKPVNCPARRRLPGAICQATYSRCKSHPVSAKSAECAYQNIVGLLQALVWECLITQECPANRALRGCGWQCDATLSSNKAESGRRMSRLPAVCQQSKRQGCSIAPAKPKAVSSHLAHPEVQLRHAEYLWLPDESYAQCRPTINMRTAVRVLKPVFLPNPKVADCQSIHSRQHVY